METHVTLPPPIPPKIKPRIESYLEINSPSKKDNEKIPIENSIIIKDTVTKSQNLDEKTPPKPRPRTNF